MSDIIRVKVRSKRRHAGRRSRSLAPASKKFAARFPRTYRFLSRCKSALKKNKFFSALSILLLVGGFLCGLLSLFPAFAKSYSDSLGQTLRVILALVASIVPFSLGEVLFLLFLLFLPVWFFTLVRALIRKYRFKRIHRKMRRVLLAPVAVLMVVLILFLFTFAPSYQSQPLARTLGISESEVHEDDLADTMSYLVKTINEDIQSVTFDENGASVMPYDFSTLSQKLSSAFHGLRGYSKLCPKAGAPAKQFLLSPILVKFDLAGVYTFFTGEANVNTAYPDLLLPITTAHELSHQRGIAAENDADFLAFVACASADDAFIRYSGHLNTLSSMIREIRSALADHEDAEFAATVAEELNEILAELDPRAEADLSAYSAYVSEHHSETLSSVTSDLNDTYLKSQGQSAGQASYQYLTGLVVNFYTTYLA